MASIVYNTAKQLMADGTIDLDTNTIKVMLVTSTYTPDKDHDYVDAGGASDPCDAEIDVTGYTRGFNGAGRKTLASADVTTDKTNDRAEFDATDVTWTALGSGATIAGAILIKEGTSDADSRLIAYIDLTDTATNGGDITIQWNAEGILQLA
jgi:hypothetical protein